MSAKPALPLDVIRSAPPHVARVFDFSDWQATHPNEELPGDSVDAEFDHSNATINALIDRAALIQRDDGQLLNGIVTLDAMDPAVLDAIEEDADAAQASATAAAASAAAAAASETDAEAAAAAAAISEANALVSETAAELAETNAETARDAAAASAATAAAAEAAIEDIFILPSPGDANKAVWVNETGDAYVLGEAIRYSGLVWLGEDRRLSSIADPVDPQDAATKQYVLDTVSLAGSVPPPVGTDAGKFLKTTAENVFGWHAAREVPTGGAAAEVLKNSGGDAYAWGTVREVTLPAGGDAGKYLKATGAGTYAWDTPREVPTPASPGDNAKVLMANAGLFGWTAFTPTYLSGVQAFITTFLQAADTAAARAAIAAQQSDATLTALAGLDPVAADAGKMLFATGADTFALSEAVLGGWENRFINGDFRFHQYIASTGIAAGVQYVADRWLLSQAGAFVSTVSRAAAHPIAGANGTCLQIQFTTPDASLAAGDVAWIGQRIEGYHCRDIFDGGASQMATLVFWVYATVAGIYSVFVRNGVDRTICKQFTINAANTWERKSLTFPMGTWSGGTWNRTNGIGLEIGFTLAAGSTFVGALDAWGATTVLAGAGQANAGNATNNVFRLADVMFIPGSIVPARFMHRHHAHEFSLCQRYQQKSFSPDQPPVTALGAGTGEYIWQQITAAGSSSFEKIIFSPRMRTAPSLLLRNPINANGEARNYSGGGDLSSTVASGVTDSGFFIQATNIGAQGHLNALHWWAGAEL